MSFGLPHNTVVVKALPKKALYTKSGVKTSVRDHFDADVSRLVISHEISPQSVPAIAAGEITTIYVLGVLLKRKEFDRKNIELLAKLIPQRMVFALQFNQETMLAIFNERLFCGQWQSTDATTIPLNGLNLDAVWQNLVTTIGGITIQDGNSLTEQILADEQHEKLLKQIAFLENKMRTTKQPRRKLELHNEILSLKQKYHG